MDDDEMIEQVNYVLIVRKSPLLLAGAIVFAMAAWKCYEAWTMLNPVNENAEE